MEDGEFAGRLEDFSVGECGRWTVNKGWLNLLDIRSEPSVIGVAIVRQVGTRSEGSSEGDAADTHLLKPSSASPVAFHGRSLPNCQKPLPLSHIRPVKSKQKIGRNGGKGAFRKVSLRRGRRLQGVWWSGLYLPFDEVATAAIERFVTPLRGADGNRSASWLLAGELGWFTPGRIRRVRG